MIVYKSEAADSVSWNYKIIMAYKEWVNRSLKHLTVECRPFSN